MKLIKPSEINNISQLPILINKELEKNLSRLNLELKHWYDIDVKIFYVRIYNKELQHERFFNQITYLVCDHLTKNGWKWKFCNGPLNDIKIYHPDYKSPWQKLREWWAI